MGKVINMDAGHNKYAPGASSFLDEVAENRKVHKQLTADLKASGFVVNNCTDDSGRTADDVLYNIVVKSNKINADLHISLHLNSGRNDKIGDGKTGGTEVFNYDERTKALSDLICKQIAADLGITNRGTKYEPEYYVLRKTNALAILIECCFTDDKDDYKKWDAIKCAHAIAKAVCAYYGVTYKGGGSVSTESKPSTPAKKPTSAPEVKGRGYAAGKWWGEVSSKTTSGTESYIGVKGQPLRALQLNTVGDASVAGKLKYRLRKLGGGWYNWQIDREMDKNGENFAGDKIGKFDCLQISLEGLSGYTAEYRAYDSKHGWMPWVRGYNNSNSNGYAGWDGYAIECVQVRIVKK